jgi:hypothetical protein
MKQLLPCSMFLLFLLSLSPRAALSDDTFFESDEYQEEEAGVVDVFLREPEYRLMVEDLERNDTSFDWGWVRTVAFRPEPPAAARAETAPADKSIRGRMKSLIRGRSSGRAMESEVLQPLAFDLRQHRTVRIPEVQNFAGIARKGMLEDIREAFVEGAKALGLEVSTSGDPDMELAIALVDQLRSEVDVPVYNIHVQPHIALELRLTNLETGEDLLLVRNRKHGASQSDAALNFADDLVKFLR